MAKGTRKKVYKNDQPTKRKYTKRAAKWGIMYAQPPIKIDVSSVVASKPDELDLIRDMLAAFESLSDDGRFRAYAYFKNKHSQYDYEAPAKWTLIKKNTPIT